MRFNLHQGTYMQRNFVESNFEPRTLLSRSRDIPTRPPWSQSNKCIVYRSETCNFATMETLSYVMQNELFYLYFAIRHCPNSRDKNPWFAVWMGVVMFSLPANTVPTRKESSTFHFSRKPQTSCTWWSLRRRLRG
ncbi:hypothetical protein AVEN_196376-1 [Araneus ventricosus]|uniref:Uncharacterized protein n=1 Tax=Araneus ventricosus TaxID=182803 RepID=A0A4Y2AU12_ARAVE|nr:hypothetical protein AVEN_196376-1 [Araneus ventricosus]